MRVSAGSAAVTWKTLLSLAMFALFLMSGVSDARAAKTFTVNSSVDRWDQDTTDGECETVVPNECTLRAAIQEANVAPGADEIGFSVSLVELAIQGNSEELGVSGDLDITDHVTIDGGGVVVGTNSNLGDRILHLVCCATEIKNLTIAGGSERQGGGIYVGSGAMLDLTDSAVRSNTATSNTDPQGGGIYSAGELKVTRSAIASNTTVSATSGSGADKGGGLHVSGGGTASISDSLISGNTANGAAISYGGGISGGINSNLTLTNVTVSGNTADQGGGFYGTGDLANVTLNENSAGFGANLYQASGSTTLKNTIVATPQGGSNCEGTPTSQGHNLEYPGTSCGFTGTGDKQNQDPLLGPLSNTGGPTRTYPLMWGSPTVDAGSNTGCPSTDQRGISRPQDGDGNGSIACDIGAFEVDIKPPTVKSVTPGKGEKEVRRNTSVRATFSEKMHPDSLITSTVTLKNTKTGAQEQATVTLSADGKTVTLDPSKAKLAKKTKYQARVEGGAGGAGDLAGNALAADKIWTFTTGRK